MKIVQINSTCGSGSTGKICTAVSRLLTEKGIENYILYAVGHSTYPLGIRYMSDNEIKVQALRARVFGNYGFQAKKATKRLIDELERIAPDIVHLHNLHSHNIHLGILFNWFREKRIKVFWTFHDCWAFTGYCPHYDMIGCDQWKRDGCKACPQKRHFSWFFDRSSYLFAQKKALFVDLDLTVITPSQWLADEVSQSFLKDCRIKVIYNGIDLLVFYPQESDFRQKHGLENRFIVLGVAFDWSIRKGLDVFVELSKRLDERFQIVLVGTNDKVDKQLPDNILSIHRTQDQAELAAIYTAADVFVNPTREEVLGLTNIEANACGTPVITFNTGGSPECIDKYSGCVLEKGNIDMLESEIIRTCCRKGYFPEKCIDRAKAFDENKTFQEYIAEYENGL